MVHVYLLHLLHREVCGDGRHLLHLHYPREAAEIKRYVLVAVRPDYRRELCADGLHGVWRIVLVELHAEITEIVFRDILPLRQMPDEVAEARYCLDTVRVFPYPCPVEGVAPFVAVVVVEIALTDGVGVLLDLRFGKKVFPSFLLFLFHNSNVLRVSICSAKIVILYDNTTISAHLRLHHNGSETT